MGRVLLLFLRFVWKLRWRLYLRGTLRESLRVRLLLLLGLCLRRTHGMILRLGLRLSRWNRLGRVLLLLWFILKLCRWLNWRNSCGQTLRLSLRTSRRNRVRWALLLMSLRAAPGSLCRGRVYRNTLGCGGRSSGVGRLGRLSNR